MRASTHTLRAALLLAHIIVSLRRRRLLSERRRQELFKIAANLTTTINAVITP